MMPISAGKGQASNELAQLFDIISNKELYEQRLKDLADAESEANKARESLTKAKDLDAALLKVKKLDEQAEKELADANQEAARIIIAARDEAGKIKMKFELECEAKQAELSKQALEIAERDESSKKIAENAEAKDQRSNKLLSEVMERERVLSLAEAELKQKQEALKTAMSVLGA